jgi:hypothetical protein
MRALDAWAKFRVAADALDALPEQPAEATERLQRLCVEHKIA